ncbi:MAG: biopolymer transporter ExbD [Geitlerinemataceae cyanobacterium]
MFKERQQTSQIPEVNLVPMMDVLMSVLTFFIILAMTLTGQGIPNVELPSAQDGTGGGGEGTSEKTEAKRLVVGLDSQGQILVEGEVIQEEQLAEKVEPFLAENPEGAVTLSADRTLDYQKVDLLLQKLQEIGGERVSLAIK